MKLATPRNPAGISRVLALLMGCLAAGVCGVRAEPLQDTNTHSIVAEPTKVTPKLRALNEIELRELLTAALQRDYIRERGQLELHLQRAWAPVNVPNEPLMVKVLDFPASGLGSSMII